ncbi:hypothetical protein DAEQUDRAFT_354242 [Daedalea quercina L-15889]|uniref:Uncharacterized protein n=1 Tax=Daedalea quercina L-15889 TaxID=1314783 RepID=A0A165TQG8_9APHY|nr:hypothetical protein DAEQUDRAFT_354242 [Daedalea quercina L-15889]
MNGRESDSQAKATPPRLALITPSASPPSSRSLSLLTSRISLDRPPPTKRPRLGSTPSSPFSVSTPAPSTVDQFDAQRREASQRLMDIWAGLAERYNRPLDEDDIIDLRDGSIIKDRGVLRRAEKTYEVGYFAGEDAPSDANDANSDYGGVQTDDDVDPLDAFAPEADISGELELEKEKRHVPPVRALDPADAEDLHEFLEAERLRKEQYGDEEDEEEVVHLTSETSPLEPHSGSERRASLAGDEQQLDDDDNSGSVVAGYGDDKDGLGDMSEKPPPVPSNGLSVDDDESEDEFATWDFDTTTPVRPTNTRRPLTPVDVIDLTESPLSSPSHASRGRSTIPVKLTNIQPEFARGKSVHRGSARTPARANTVAQEDAVAKRRAPSRAKTPARSKTPARRKSSMPPPPLPHAFIGQLATPPPSSSSVIESTPETRASFTPRSLSPSPPPSPPPLPKPRPRPRYQGALRVSSNPIVENPQAAPATHSTQSGANPRTPKAGKYKLVPEVVITTRAHPAGSSLQTSSSAPDTEPFSAGKADAEQPPIRGETSRKGNTKENNDRRKTVNNDAGCEHAQRSTLDKEPTDGRATTSDVDQRDSDSDVPPRPKKRKRKRVLSSSSLSGTSDKEDPFPTIIPIAPPRSRRKNVPKDVPGPSSGRRTPKPVRKTTQSVDDDDSGTLQCLQVITDGILIMICDTQTMLDQSRHLLSLLHGLVHHTDSRLWRQNTMVPLHTHHSIVTLTSHSHLASCMMTLMPR